MRPLDQITVGALTSAPERLSSLSYVPRRPATDQAIGQGLIQPASASDAATAPGAQADRANPPALSTPTGTAAGHGPLLGGPLLSGPLLSGPGLSGMAARTSGAASEAVAVTAPFVRLVPSSGVQFLDFTISADGLSRTVGQFTEDHIEADTGQRTVLVDVGRDAGEDGVVWHPLTKRPLGPEEFLTISGFAGLEPFLDTWVPLPYLRFRGRLPTGHAVHDPGPANWVRAYIATPKVGLRAAKTLSVVLAFDTRLAPVYATGDAADIGPSAYDALFGSTFQVIDKLADLGMFVSEPWVDSWLQGGFNDFCRRQAARPEAMSTGAPAGRFQLEHIARYLTYLAVLTRSVTLPQIRFADSFSNAWQMPVTGVDLVLDMTAEKTCALLVMRDAAHDQAISADAVLTGAEPLLLRDLNNPVRLYNDPPSTTVEFDGHHFGNVVASRRSGRTDAFLWPSLVRVGTEAERLALRTSATPGITGRQGLFAGLNEIAISEAVWRFSRDDATGVDQGPIVAGEALAHLTEDGTVISRFDHLAPPAIRPRFSDSSLIGLFVGELLMHALVQINRPTSAPHIAPVVAPATATSMASTSPPPTEASAGAVRQLQHILVTVASAVSDEDRRLLQTRIEGAIDLIWKAMRWDEATTVASPPKPQVSLGIGSDVAAQLVYVFEEIKTRFGGDPTEYLRILRRPATQRAASTFRIARLDFEAASTGLTIVDYAVSNDGGVWPSIVAAERSMVGRDAVVAAFANGLVWPAIAEQLHGAGVADPRAFLTELMAEGATRTGVPLPAHFARRFDGKIIRSAAESCLQSCEAVVARAADTARAFTVKTLVGRGGGRLSGLAQHFDQAAAAAGAVNFRLENVTVRFRQRHAASLIRHALEPVVGLLGELIAAQGCDLVLVDGRMAQLPDLIDELRRRVALPAHCIINVGAADPVRSASQPQVGQHRRMGGAVGAYLASQQALRAGNFKLVTADVAGSLQHYRPVAISRSGRSTRLLADANQPPGIAPPLLAEAIADGSGWTPGLLARATAAGVNASAVHGTGRHGPDSNRHDGDRTEHAPAYQGAPRRRYAGAEREQ